MAWHKAIAATPHPNGPPVGYCTHCSYVVVRFQGQWWHLAAKSQDRRIGKAQPDKGVED